MWNKNYYIIAFMTIFLIGCTPKHGTESYDGNEVGQPTKVIKGTVIGIKEVEIHGSNELGSSIGAGAGMAAGLSMGRSFEGNILGAIIGALIGSYVGASIEEESTKGKGYEFLIRQENTNTMLAFIQRENKENIIVGDKVLLYIGKTTRISKASLYE